MHQELVLRASQSPPRSRGRGTRPHSPKADQRLDLHENFAPSKPHSCSYPGRNSRAPAHVAYNFGGTTSGGPTFQEAGSSGSAPFVSTDVAGHAAIMRPRPAAASASEREAISESGASPPSTHAISGVSASTLVRPSPP